MMCVFTRVSIFTYAILLRLLPAVGGGGISADDVWLLDPSLLGAGVLSMISTALLRLLCADESALVIASRGWSGNMASKTLVCSGDGGSSSDPATSLPVIVSKYS